MAKLYERVKLVRPLHLDFTGHVMSVGSEATVVDLLDDDVVLIEFDLDGSDLQFAETVASVHDLVPIQ